jgi:hypothetical protein
MPSTTSAAGNSTAGSLSSAVLPTTGAPTSSDGDTLSSPATGVPSTMANPSLNISSPSGTAAGVPLSHAFHSVSIKALVPYTLDMESYNYTKWRVLFSMVLSRFNLLHHVTDDAAHPADIEWTKDDLLIGNWIYSTISEKLLDMCLRLESPTARKIWVHLGSSQATSLVVRSTLSANCTTLFKARCLPMIIAIGFNSWPILLRTVMYRWVSVHWFINSSAA